MQVAGLKEDLTRTLVRVGEKAEAATVLIGKMGVERKKVEEQQALAAVEAAKAKTVSEVANRISDECKEDLEKALPILERAKDAVNVSHHISCSNSVHVMHRACVTCACASLCQCSTRSSFLFLVLLFSPSLFAVSEQGFSDDAQVVCSASRKRALRHQRRHDHEERARSVGHDRRADTLLLAPAAALPASLHPLGSHPHLLLPLSMSIFFFV